MSSGYKGNWKTKLIRSFAYAIEGIVHSIKREQNVRIHFMIAIVVICLGFYYHITTTEWLFVLFAIGGMVSLELMNTAIERTVDLVTQQKHPLAKQAKDAAAGAVLIFAIISVIIGCIIFLPKIL